MVLSIRAPLFGDANFFSFENRYKNSFQLKIRVNIREKEEKGKREREKEHPRRKKPKLNLIVFQNRGQEATL